MDQVEYRFACPYCWEEISMLLDLSVGSQNYQEDCEVCCHPINIDYTVAAEEIVNFAAHQADDE